MRKKTGKFFLLNKKSNNMKEENLLRCQAVPFVRPPLGLETQEPGLWQGEYRQRQGRGEAEHRGVGW